MVEKQWASSVHLDGERCWGLQGALEDWASGDQRVSAHGPALFFGFVCLFLAKSVEMAEAPSWMLVQLIIPVEFLPPKTLISLHFKRKIIH